MKTTTVQSTTTGADIRRQEQGAFALRLGVGAVMIAHALGKYFVFTLPGTAGFFEKVGYPGWTAYPVFALELVGGVLLVLGVKSRWVAAALVPVMLGALRVHLGNGWMFTQPNGGWEYPAFLTVALVAQALMGDGAWALKPGRSRDATPSGAPAKLEV